MGERKRASETGRNPRVRWGEKGRETRRKMAVSGRMRWRERERD